MTGRGIAIAPAHPEGEHNEAYKKCPSFPLNVKIRLTCKINPWRRHSPGRRFFDEVLIAKQPATVGQAIEYAVDIGYTARQAMNHLRWLFTWGGAYLRVNGKLYEDYAPTIQPARKIRQKESA